MHKSLLDSLSLAGLIAGATVVALPTAWGQTQHYSLESPRGLRLHNVTAEAATLDSKKGVRLAITPEVMQRSSQMTPEERNALGKFAILPDVEFSSGVIEVELAGTPPPGDPGARGFVGIAFRLQNDLRTYDAFYLRPTNGRAEDQERRNHATQYISHPDWPWFRLRSETPSKYESYVDLVSGSWTKVRIEVRGDKARLYVHDAEQPVLIVNDVKSGPAARGAVALWIDWGTTAHFRNLIVRPRADERN